MPLDGDMDGELGGWVALLDIVCVVVGDIVVNVGQLDLHSVAGVTRWERVTIGHRDFNRPP